MSDLTAFWAGFSVANGIWVLLWLLRSWMEKQERKEGGPWTKS